MTTKNKIQHRLIVSFIGNTDLNHLPPNEKDCSPILRLLLELSSIEPLIPYRQTSLILFNEDKDPKTERTDFCNKLQAYLPKLGLGEIIVQRQPISLPDGPTDLNALYEGVWTIIPTSGRQRSENEVVFHFSSGTPAMKLTLLLAANCLPLDHVRIFETSAEQGVKEVRPPYVLAAREIRGQNRTAVRLKLNDKASKTLLDNTVIDDPQVKAGYAVIYKCASGKTSELPPRLLIKGPTGSGKWHACQQFAKWREKPVIEWINWQNEPEFQPNCTLGIKHLDDWPENALEQLTELSASRPDIAIAATYRTDRVQQVPLDTLARVGLRGAVHVELPSLGARSDVPALGTALARQIGIADGKLKERLQYDWLTDLYPNNLHDLKQLLVNASAYSSGKHPENDAYRHASESIEAENLFSDAWRILSGLTFGPGQPTLDQVLVEIRYATVCRLVTQGRNQTEAGKLVGLDQRTVSDILKNKPVRLQTNQKHAPKY
jgi:hypothetical protein